MPSPLGARLILRVPSDGVHLAYAARDTGTDGAGYPPLRERLVSVTLAFEESVVIITLSPEGGLHNRASIASLGDAAKYIAGRIDGPSALRAVVVVGDFGRGWADDALAELDGIPGVEALGAGVQALADMPQPVVAAIAGVCHGPGLEIALACDIRLAATTATFAAPETGLGTLPRAGGTQRLPRAIGRAQALRMLLTGDTIDAPEASRIGLVSSVLAPEEVEAAARALVRRIADRGPIATRMGKEAVQRGAEMTLEQALRYETDLTVLLQSTADRAEGVRAFAAKRPPRFSGR